MDFVKTAFDVALTCWDRTADYRKYIRSLDDNLKALESKKSELDSVYGDVEMLVRRAEGEGWISKGDAAQWLQKVKKLGEEADMILVDGKQMMEMRCLCGICFNNCLKRYKQSKDAETKRAALEAELGRGRNFKGKDDVAYEPDNQILKRSLKALEDKRDELCSVFYTVKLQVEMEERQRMERTPEVGGWLRKVEDLLEKEVPEILEQGRVEMAKVSPHREGEVPQAQRKFPSLSGISKHASDIIVKLEGELRRQREFRSLTYKPADPLIVERALDCHVGAESMFGDVWDWVEDDTVKRIGLWGMGGVGKTALLTKVHNEFVRVTHDYDFVLWIVVSRPAKHDKIQEAIFKKLKAQKDDWKDLEETERVGRIQFLMKNRNFLLFLDDLWDPINLLEDVGIPCRDNPKKYKIIFTTREERVCRRMKADRIKKVECLSSDEALQLFRQTLGENTWNAHPKIPQIAKELVRECKNLPLAVKTVAGAMTGRKESDLWREAQMDLKDRLSKFQDMEKEVLIRLEFSYDRLPDETHRICFQYLSIFQEDYDIVKQDVIGLWIGEGFLDEYGNVHKARATGEKIFRRLKDACLLDFVGWFPELGEIFKMHDVVREMALWVYSEHGVKDRVLVLDRLELFGREERKKSEDVERMSIWGLDGELHDLTAVVSFSNLSTLLIDTIDLMLPDDFFLSMPHLRVLRLTSLDLSTLPNSIWNLVKLRYLNITRVFVQNTKVPTEIKNLNKLEVLILSRHIMIPVEVLSHLSSIRVFHCTCTPPMVKLDFGNGDNELLDMLMKMQGLEEISLTLSSKGSVEILLDCPDLCFHLRELNLMELEQGDFRIKTSSRSKLGNLQTLTINSCRLVKIDIIDEFDGAKISQGMRSYGESPAHITSGISSWYSFNGLTDVQISFCERLEDVTSLIYHAPLLESLYIGACESLEEVIVGDVEDGHLTNGTLFQSLKYLLLEDLDSLKRICRRALRFPSLKEIRVSGCYKLGELSLDCNSAKNSLEVIEGEEQWWAGLKWDRPATKEVFSAKYARLLDDLSDLSGEEDL